MVTPAKRKTLTILGATGSIGESTMAVLAEHPGRFEVEAVTAQTNVAKLADIARQTGARHAVVGDASLLDDLRDALSGSGIEPAAGKAALIEAASRPCDLVVSAIVGIAGLAPTRAAVAAGNDVALANKESLVCGGSLLMEDARRGGVAILPVDSEHNAVLQCLDTANPCALEKVTITASGGPFRTWSVERIRTATAKEALNHPNWAMGRKVTVDSAGLVNKGLELIEAMHLFSLPPEQLDAVVHPQSVVHGMAYYCDGSVVAHLANPSMTVPIAHCLAHPERLHVSVERVDLVKLASLTFEPIDRVRFPAFALAEATMRAGQHATIALNGANEVLVEAFLTARIPFGGIADGLDAVLGNTPMSRIANYDDVADADIAARQAAERWVAARN